MHVDGSAGVSRAAAALVGAQGEAVDEGLSTQLAAVGMVAGAVKAAVQFQVDVLGELGVAQLTLVRLLPRMEAQVGLQVAGAAEPLMAHLGREG